MEPQKKLLRIGNCLIDTAQVLTAEKKFDEDGNIESLVIFFNNGQELQIIATDKEYRKEPRFVKPEEINTAFEVLSNIPRE